MLFSTRMARRLAGVGSLFALALVLGWGCGGKSSGGKAKVIVYTSIYESVLAEISPLIAKELPEIEVEWFQKGSEIIAGKVNSEIAAGKIQADIIMTSDPFWYEELKSAGHLVAYDSARAAEIPAELKDPEKFFLTVRVPVMVLAVNRAKLPAGVAVNGFKDLADPALANLITMGNPLESGSMFTAVAALSQKYGWEYFQALRKNNLLAAGGNSAVLNRVVTGERPIGIILLENLLQAHKDTPTTPAEIVYPSDGAILVPSPIAIAKTGANPKAVKKIYDFMLSDEGQTAIVRGQMYSPIDRIAPPESARSWKDIRDGAIVPWTPAYLKETLARREEIRREFSRIVVE